MLNEIHSSLPQAPNAAPLAQTPSRTTLLATLRNTLASVTLSHLADTEIRGGNKMLLVDYSLGLTQAKAAEGHLLRSLKLREGEGFVLKFVVLVLRQFVDSIKVPNKLDGADIIEVAEEIMQRHLCDTIEDIILALKQARMGGATFYNKLDQSDVWRSLGKYFDGKSDWLVNEHRNQKAQGMSQDYSDVVQVGEMVPNLHQQMGLRLDPAHPNFETLRRKLTLTNSREKRGLITTEEAAQSRADVAAANKRKPRSDWGPSPEAQRRMDGRNWEEDKRYR